MPPSTAGSTPASQARRRTAPGVRRVPVSECPGAYAVDQLVQRHGHHQLRTVAAVVGQLARAERQSADLAQRVGAALTRTAVVVLTGWGAERIDRLAEQARGFGVEVAAEAYLPVLLLGERDVPAGLGPLGGPLQEP